MKKIIINENNIFDEEITDKRVINNYIYLNEEKILLSFHHNSYYFLHDDSLKDDCDKELVLIKKIYELDYPLIGDKCLIIKNYYLIRDDVNIDNTKWLKIYDAIDILNNQKYNNPRVQDITDEIIEVINKILT